MAIEDSSTLQIALHDTLVLDKGTGDPTFTRTTTANAFTNEGYLIEVPSGVARFSGSRLVTNKVPSDITEHSSPSMTVTEPVSGEYLVTADAAVSWVGTFPGAVTLDNKGINKFRLTFSFKPGTQTWVRMLSFGPGPSNVWFYLNTDTQAFGSINSVNVAGDITLTDVGIAAHGTRSGFYTVSCLITFTGLQGEQHNFNLYFVDDNDLNSGATILNNDITYTEYSLQEVFGQSDTTSSEFVSKGEASSPYHGAGADGAKWFSTNKDGSPISDASLLGYLNEPAATNQCLWNRDLTNAVWVKTNVTAALTQTGIDNLDNSASLLTFNAANATILQTITLAAATRSYAAFVKRVTGTGTIEMTRDGGSTWTDVTSSINSSTYTQVGIKGTSVLNPQVGFRAGTSGDEIAVDYCQDEAGSKFTSPIFTTTVAATRNADVLTYQTASNFSDTEGAISAYIETDDWANVSGNIGSATTGLAASSANEGVQALDGTNTVNGPTGTPTGRERVSIGWEGSDLKAASGGVLGTAGSYDGSFNLTSIEVLPEANIRNLNIWTTALTDLELAAASNGLPVDWRHNDDAFHFLGLLGYTGTINDRLTAYLRALYSNEKPLQDNLATYIKANGHILPPQ